ncbi:MAG TPA: hypothetical protein VE131_12195 [Terriglobales bacterium]|nr:hypothetical protein [Terriglobales bacterium]
MKLVFLTAVGLLLVVPSGYTAGQTASVDLPSDVARFKKRRDICDHFRGEEPYDEERRKFLKENLRKYCSGSDKELASLKKKYSDSIAVLKALAGYEGKIEGSD